MQAASHDAAFGSIEVAFWGNAVRGQLITRSREPPLNRGLVQASTIVLISDIRLARL
jgi:hypothetical protein